MLFSYSNCLYIILLMLILYVCAGHAYRVNSKRATDDPKKRDIPLGAVLLTPVTWPLLLIGAISLFILRAVAYGVFLILFTIALVLIRKPFLLKWLNDKVVLIGDKLLTANTLLIKMAFGGRSKKTQSI